MGRAWLLDHVPYLMSRGVDSLRLIRLSVSSYCEKAPFAWNSLERAHAAILEP